MGRKPKLPDKILAYLEAEGPARFTAIKEAVKAKAYPLTYALNKLVEQGLVERTFMDGKVTYQLTRNFFETKMREALKNLIAQQKISLLRYGLLQGENGSLQYDNPILQIGDFKVSNKTLLALEEALEENGQLGIIFFNCNDLKILQNILKWIFIDKFNSWHKALNEGWLNHRTYLSRYAKELGGEIIRYVNLNKLPPAPLLKEKLDPKESWTIGDIIKMHPLGRSAEFWQAILQKCIEIGATTETT